MSRASVESLRAYLENLKQKYLVPFERELAALESLAKGAQQAVSYEDYTTMISSLSILAKDHYRVGQNIYISTVGVPDLWVYGILEEFSPYLYLNDEQLVLEIASKGYVDIGWYRLSQLETQKVDLPEYVKFTDTATYNKAGVGKTSTTYGVSTTEGYFTVAKAHKDEILAKNSGYKPIVPNTLDYAVKVGITTNTEEWTDEEKAAACETIGALEKSPLARKLYGTNNANEQKMWGIATSAAISDSGYIPQYHSQTSGVGNESNIPDGVLITNTPVNPYHCATKKYVDDLIAELRAEIAALKGE